MSDNPQTKKLSANHHNKRATSGVNKGRFIAKNARASAASLGSSNQDQEEASSDLPSHSPTPSSAGDNRPPQTTTTTSSRPPKRQPHHQPPTPTASRPKKARKMENSRPSRKPEGEATAPSTPTTSQTPQNGPVAPLSPPSLAARLFTPASLVPLLGLAPGQPRPFSILDLPRQAPRRVAAPAAPVEYSRREFDHLGDLSRPRDLGVTDVGGLMGERVDELGVKGGERILSAEEKEEMRRAEIVVIMFRK